MRSRSLRWHRSIPRILENRIQRREHRVLARVRRVQVHEGHEATGQVEKDLLRLRGRRLAARSQLGHRDKSSHGTKHNESIFRYIRSGSKENTGSHGKRLLSEIFGIRSI